MDVEKRIYCDCCNPPQLMAIQRGERLVIHAVHHGKKHVAVVMLLPQRLDMPQKMC